MSCNTRYDTHKLYIQDLNQQTSPRSGNGSFPDRLHGLARSCLCTCSNSQMWWWAVEAVTTCSIDRSLHWPNDSTTPTGGGTRVLAVKLKTAGWRLTICIQKKPRKWRRRGSNSLCFDPFRHEIDSVGTAIVIEIDRRPGPYIPSHSVWDVAAKHMRAMLVPPSPFSFYADVCVPNSAALTVRDSFATFIS